MKQIVLILLLLSAIFLFFSPGLLLPYGHNFAAGKYRNIRGFKMYYETYGKGKPLLMIHGNNGSISTFKNNIPYFCTKYKVIVADSRSQGLSMDKSDSLSFEMMADDEAALLDSLHIKSAYVLGWSDGGIIALLMAVRHPGKVTKLAASGANLRPDSSAVNGAIWRDEQAIYNTSKNKVLKTYADKTKWKLFLLDWLQPNIPLNEINSINCPALIMGGDHDIIPVKHTMQIAKNIPKAKLWIVAHSGHATLVEHQDEFNKRIDYFFEPLHAHSFQ